MVLTSDVILEIKHMGIPVDTIALHFGTGFKLKVSPFPRRRLISGPTVSKCPFPSQLNKSKIKV